MIDKSNIKSIEIQEYPSQANNKVLLTLHLKEKTNLDGYMKDSIIYKIDRDLAYSKFFEFENYKKL